MKVRVLFFMDHSVKPIARLQSIHP